MPLGAAIVAALPDRPEVLALIMQPGRGPVAKNGEAGREAR